MMACCSSGQKILSDILAYGKLKSHDEELLGYPPCVECFQGCGTVTDAPHSRSWCNARRKSAEVARGKRGNVASNTERCTMRASQGTVSEVTVSSLKRMRNVYHYLHETMLMVDSTFGFQMLVAMISSFTYFIWNAKMAISVITDATHKEMSFITIFITTTVMWSIANFPILVVTTFLPQHVANKREKIISLLQKLSLQKTLNPVAMMEVQIFSHQVFVRPVVFTAWGLFSLDRELMMVNRGGYKTVPEYKDGERREIPEETRRPAASYDMIAMCVNPGATRPGIVLGSPLRSKCALVAASNTPPAPKPQLQLRRTQREPLEMKYEECPPPPPTPPRAGITHMSGEYWAALNIEVLRASEGEV
ncbi:hypothetical protein PR048_031772 [Dryococelus australis]|uniref:Gustatory receptor n=1 Tax=Dryococelus australis TaxID=614101 RepID=A0ABQ9G6U7_9NEOP|nr:hypothetical protein PR048_031772 [Dryococelus australis]